MEAFVFFPALIVMLDYSHRLFLVSLHYGCVPDNIGEHNSCELAGGGHKWAIKVILLRKIHSFYEIVKTGVIF
jgi:hypothetical protein